MPIRMRKLGLEMCSWILVAATMELVGARWYYVLLLCSFVLPGAGNYSENIINLPDLYSLDEPFTASELFPSCVDILDIWPTPNSILKPYMEESTFSDYIIQLWFSRPLKVQLDSVVTLSVSINKLLNLVPYYATYFGGSERNLLAYFRIPNNLKFARLVNLNSHSVIFSTFCCWLFQLDKVEL